MALPWLCKKGSCSWLACEEVLVAGQSAESLWHFETLHQFEGGTMSVDVSVTIGPVLCLHTENNKVKPSKSLHPLVIRDSRTGPMWLPPPALPSPGGASDPSRLPGGPCTRPTHGSSTDVSVKYSRTQLTVSVSGYSIIKARRVAVFSQWHEEGFGFYWSVRWQLSESGTAGSWSGPEPSFMLSRVPLSSIVAGYMSR